MLHGPDQSVKLIPAAQLQVAPLPSAEPGYVPFTLDPNSSTYSMEVKMREKATFTEALSVKVTSRPHLFAGALPIYHVRSLIAKLFWSRGLDQHNVL